MKRLGLIALLPLLLTSCETVTPAAWVYFKADNGYVSYTTDMYGVTGDHIYYYLNEEDKGDRNNADLTFRFAPRILGPDEREIEGETKRCMCIDLSEKYIDMMVTVYSKNGYYDESKSIYLNDTKLTPEDVTTGSYGAMLYFEDLAFTRGNPNGHINNEINKIEYK